MERLHPVETSDGTALSVRKFLPVKRLYVARKS